jgi:hypothetical protein
MYQKLLRTYLNGGYEALNLRVVEIVLGLEAPNAKTLQQ